MDMIRDAVASLHTEASKHLRTPAEVLNQNKTSAPVGRIYTIFFFEPEFP